MADSATPFLALVKPENFASEDTWGTKLNGDFDLVDAAVQALVEARNYAAAGGSADALTLVLDPAPLALVDGLEARFKAAGANTVSPTLNVGGLGAKAIKFADGGSLGAGALAAGVIYSAVFNAGADCWVIGAVGGAAASAAETLAGTDAARFLTAAGFAGNKSLATNGYYRLPGGLTLQWGTDTSNIAGGSTFTATFPVAFGTACVFAIATPRNPAGGLNEDIQGLQWKSASITSASFFCQDGSQNAGGANWFAVGY
jgi:hypothetical protein